MLYDSTDMSLGDVEIIVLYNQFGKIYLGSSLGQFDF